MRFVFLFCSVGCLAELFLSSAFRTDVLTEFKGTGSLNCDRILQKVFLLRVIALSPSQGGCMGRRVNPPAIRTASL